MASFLSKCQTACLGVLLALSGHAGAEPLHLALNMKRDFAGPASVGFNLADVNSHAALSALPPGMKGVYWLGNGFNTKCHWQLSDRQVTDAVNSVKEHPKFSGIYYISDEPHPANCPNAPEEVARRSALIHALDQRSKTFMIVLNPASDQTEFARMKDSADLIGVDPYPCNRNNVKKGCDLAALRRRIEQARTAGIDAKRIVPVFQAFGQSCTTQDRPYYRLPSVKETKAMLAIWDEMVPRAERAFDVTYSWGIQPRVACPSLKTANGDKYPDLQVVFAEYIRSVSSATSSPGAKSFRAK
jgi:hypothetical protein